jgi:hypothetical protein
MIALVFVLTGPSLAGSADRGPWATVSPVTYLIEITGIS